MIGIALPSSAAPLGANLPYITYEAEAMRTNATVLGPKYEPYAVETESSGQRCVQLSRSDQYLEFNASSDGDALVVRYSLSDAPAGGGVSGSVDLVVNGAAPRKLALTSRYSHLYGRFPFSNDPKQGRHRNYYDELRVPSVTIHAGDIVRLQNFAGAEQLVIDCVDVERVAPTVAAPSNSLSVRDFGARGDGRADDTAALRACVDRAKAEHRIVWVPSGEYKLTGDIVLPDGVRVQGAGMWYTTFVGDEDLYAHADRRVRFRVTGTGVALADFAILGRLNYRNDQEPNDGVVGQNCTSATIDRIWIEHTKTGVWIYNGTQLRIAGCRFRDLLADGVNLCVGTTGTVVDECSARGTGDDCFAMWPVPDDQGFVQRAKPGHNVIRHCTGQLPFLANGGCIYGGADNRIEDCRFVDISAGCGILISTTFPTSNEAGTVDNNFSGTTTIRNCEILRCGGFDHEWEWRAALQFCMDRRSISGVSVSDVTIRDSLSDAIGIVGPGSVKGEGTLSHAQLDRVTVERYGLGRASSYGLRVRVDARGEIRLRDSRIGEIANDSKAFAVQK